MQSHHQPVRPDREGCCHPSCVSCMRQRQAVPWVHALPTVLVRWVRLFHSLPPDTTCCHSCHSPFSLHLCRMKQRQAADWVHALPTVLVRWVRLFHSLPPDTTCCHSCHSPFSLHLCRMKQRQAAHWVHSLPTVLVRWDRFHSLPPAATPGTLLW